MPGAMKKSGKKKAVHTCDAGACTCDS